MRLVETPTSGTMEVLGSAALPIDFATSSKDKLEEAIALGLAVHSVIIPLTEAQGTPQQILEAKALEAYQLNGRRPTLVEDTSLVFVGMPGGVPGAYAKQYLNTPEKRQEWCDAVPANNRGAIFRVGYAVSLDGKTVTTVWGETEGEIARYLQPPFDPEHASEREVFGFDDIFIPKAEVERARELSVAPRTYAEMDRSEKAQTSARAQAVVSLREALAHLPVNTSGGIVKPPNPHIREFEEFIRAGDEPDETYLHPWLKLRGEQAQAILAARPQIPNYVPRILHPHPADRGLVLTAHDEFTDETHVVVPDEMYVEGWAKQREFYLRLANQPSRILAMKQLEERGFQPPPELPTGVIDAETIAGRIVQLADLGHADGVLFTPERHERLSQLTQDIRLLMESTQEDIHSSQNLQAAQQRVERVIDQLKAQVHRTDLLATGPFTLIRGKAFSYIGGGSNPDIFGNVLAGETAAKMGMMFGVPEVGEFSDAENEAALAKAILDRLTVDDPCLQDLPDEDKAYVVDHWRSAVVGVLPTSPKRLLERAEKLAEAGVTSFRIYGHTVGREVVDGVRILRERFPNAIIIASQVTDPEIAVLCEYAGADAVVSGVGSGGRCSTADKAQSVPDNAPLSWEERGRLRIPMIGEGGVVDNPLVGLLTGFSMANGCGSFGGTLETGGIYALTDDGPKVKDPRLFWPYNGEASSAMKQRSDGKGHKRTLRTGEPYSVEGGESRKYLERMNESMARRIYQKWEDFNLGLVVLGVDYGPFSLQAVQALSPSPLVLKTLAGASAQGFH